MLLLTPFGWAAAVANVAFPLVEHTKKTDKEIVGDLFLTTLSRLPTETEESAIRVPCFEDLQWTCL